jgi:hypothetical protein
MHDTSCCSAVVVTVLVEFICMHDTSCCSAVVVTVLVEFISVVAEISFFLHTNYIWHARPLPQRCALCSIIIFDFRWAREAQESTTLVWFLFERAATALCELFEANLTRNFRLHRYVCTLVALFVN